MNGFFVLTSSLFFLYIVRSIFFWLTIWQSNQYTPDSFFNFLTPCLVAFFVFVFLFPTELFADWQVEKAARKIHEHKDLIVIAITGSIAKSSTKDAIAHILGKEFKVVKMEGSDTTIVQIARTI